MENDKSVVKTWHTVNVRQRSLSSKMNTRVSKPDNSEYHIAINQMKFKYLINGLSLVYLKKRIGGCILTATLTVDI